MRALNHFTLQAFADSGVSDTVKIEHEGDFEVDIILLLH
jgi:hypothetical protein